MITGRQISAARGLLRWTVADLAHKSGLVAPTISKIEGDIVQPQEKTLASIVNLFDRHGVEFTEDEGVRIRRSHIRTYNGKAGYRQLLDHIYDTLKNGGHIRQFNFGDKRYLTYADDFMAEHLTRMESIKNLDARVLAVEGEPNYATGYCVYRSLDKTFTAIAPYYIYNDYVVQSLNETGNKREFVSIHSKLLAERYTAEFDLFWNRAGQKKKGK